MSKSDAETFFGRPDFQRGKFSWAKIVQPDGSEELYRRATTVAGYMEDKQGLIGWSSAMAAFGFAKSKSLLSALSVLEWKTDKDKVKDLVERAKSLGGGDEAADLGTAFHRVIERHVAGEVIDYDSLPDGFGDALDAFIQFGKDFGVTVEASELTVVDDAHQIAGTADAVFSFNEDVATPFGKIAKGTGIIGDFKTGTVADYSGLKMAQQLSIYSHADPYHAGKGIRTEWPVEINPDIGLILKVDLESGVIVPWWLDLKAAYEWVQMSLKVASVRTSSKKAIKQAAVATSKGTNVKPDTKVDDMDLEVDEKLGAREVGKLITAAKTTEELKEIKAKHGDVFTETMEKRWTERYELAGPSGPDGLNEPEDPTDRDEDQAEDMSEPSLDEPDADAEMRKEINKALGAATTVDELREVFRKYAEKMTDEQTKFATEQAEKLKVIEAEHANKAEPEPEAPAAGNETQVAMPDWVLNDDEPEAEEVKPYSVDDAKTRAAAVNNLGELRDLFKEFYKAIQSGEGDQEALTILTERSAELS